MTSLLPRLGIGFAATLSLATGCSSLNATHSSGEDSAGPDGIGQVTQSVVLPFTTFMSYAGGLTHLVTDPVAPNWEVRETRLARNEYRLSMRMKYFHAGGDGESRQVFQRRAAKLARDGGYGGYQIVSYTEGIESSAFPASQQVSEGVIQLVAKGLD
jgi:hypothetical protein